MILASALDQAFCVGADLKERPASTTMIFAAQRPVFVEAFGALRRRCGCR